MNFKKIFTADWKSLHAVIKHMHKVSGRSRVDLFRDMYACYKKGYTWMGYMVNGFYKYTDENVRRTFLSEYVDNVKIVKETISPEAREILRDKGKFSEVYKDFLKREVIDLRLSSYDEFSSFIDRHERIIVKKPFGEGGKGMEIYLTSSIDNPKDLYDKLKKNDTTIVEETIVQNEKMSEISTNSVNTIRIATAIDLSGNVTVPYMTLRYSVGDSFLDNASLGGVYSLLDDEGVTVGPAYMSVPYEKIFYSHPKTNYDFMEFKVPQIEEVKSIVKEAALVVKSARYIGWDVAISDKGPVIIEGNQTPSVDLYQTHVHLKEPKGPVKIMEKALDIKLR
ncbi:MAG: hypothetical protein CSB16_00490 [Clostridiales bacterium]|nr:MAG: hypothetical protein CSB16_00490 [Clostridiales bacterium]